MPSMPRLLACLFVQKSLHRSLMDRLLSAKFQLPPFKVLQLQNTAAAMLSQAGSLRARQT